MNSVNPVQPSDRPGQPPIVVGLGELLWDRFDDSRRPGGAPANVAFQAGQLGCQGVVCSRVGQDALGDELLAFLASQGLDTQWVQRDPDHPTGTVTVDTSRADHPEYTIHENVAWDFLESSDEWEHLMARAAAVCFGTLAQRSNGSREAIHRALRLADKTCLIVYDVNLRQQWFDRVTVERSLAASQAVKLNDHEVLVLAELLETESAEPVRFARSLQQRFAVNAVCITRAERGCLVISADEVIDSPGVAIEVADAVGAGDAFTAAWIFGQLRGWPLARQAVFANRVGALVASRSGAMPVLKEEFAQLMAEEQ
ncbi:MAG: carbohydrate kinase [Pirellulales bacterium]|nr:carbohydrate kinase [Pirellulales bacterium]